MIKHTTFRNKTLNVSTAFHSDGKIQINENGIVITELTDEAKSKLLNIDGFVNAEPVAPPPNLTKITSGEIKIPEITVPADSILIPPVVVEKTTEGVTEGATEGAQDKDGIDLPL